VLSFSNHNIYHCQLLALENKSNQIPLNLFGYIYSVYKTDNCVSLFTLRKSSNRSVVDGLLWFMKMKTEQCHQQQDSVVLFYIVLLSLQMAFFTLFSNFRCHCFFNVFFRCSTVGTTIYSNSYPCH